MIKEKKITIFKALRLLRCKTTADNEDIMKTAEFVVEKNMSDHEIDKYITAKKIKTVDLVGQLKKELAAHPTLKSKVSKKLVKDISLFLDLYKLLHKELKFQFPEKKIQDAATLGINCIIILNTSLVKIKNNKVV
jgi:hypothetical protein